MTKRTNDTEPVSALGDTQAATSTTVPSRADATAAGVVVGGRYELVAQLGRGAHGAVYRAFDRVAETEVALKLLIDLHDDTLALMRRELAAARRVTHRGVVRVFDLVELGDSDVAAVEGEGGRRAWALSMELVLGSSLEREIEHGPVTPKRLMELAELLSDALGAAHDAGVVHRDLKPQNVLVRQDGSTVITDFGVSRTSQSPDEGSVRASSNGGVTLTLEGALLGTPLYMAPEQLLGRIDVGPPADVYALGLVLYEAATGRVPHDANTVAELRERRACEAVPPLGTVRPEVPARLSEIVARCLRADPTARYATGGAVYEALHPPKVSAVLSRQMRTPGKARFTIAAVAFFVALGGVVALFLALRSAERARLAALSPAALTAESSTLANEPGPRFELKPKNPRRLTLSGVCEEFPAFFPDGRRVAYDKTVGTKSHLWERDLETGKERQLTVSPMWDFAPTISPDGRSIAFLRAEGRQRTTQLLDVESGTVREIGPYRLRPSFAPNGELWTGMNDRVSRIDPTTGEVRARLPLQGGQEVGRVRELADGSLIVVFHGNTENASGVAAYDLRADRWLGEAEGTFYDALAASPGDREAFMFADETKQIRYHDGRFTSEDRPVAFARVRAGLAISPRGDRAIWSTCASLTNLGRVEHGQIVPALDGQRDWSNLDVAFLDDGRLVFLSDRDGGRMGLWLGRPGTNDTPSKLVDVEPAGGRLAARGKKVVLGTEAGLRLLDVAYPNAALTLTTERASNPGFDVHGSVVYGTGTGDKASLRRIDPTTRVVTTIGPSPAREPSPSPIDGRVVFVAGASAERLMMLEESGRTRPFGKALPTGTFSRPTFSADASRVVVINDLTSALVIDARTERVLETISVSRGSLVRPLFSPDGTLYFVAIEWLGDLWAADLE